AVPCSGRSWRVPFAERTHRTGPFLPTEHRPAAQDTRAEDGDVADFKCRALAPAVGQSLAESDDLDTRRPGAAAHCDHGPMGTDSRSVRDWIRGPFPSV